MVNEILRAKLSDDPNSDSYYCRIENTAEKMLTVTWPTDDKGIHLPVHPDQILNFYIVREGNAYSFSGMVENVVSEPLPVVTVIISSAIERIQRRQDFRVKCLVPLEVDATLPENSDKGQQTALHLQTNAYDLSASGVSMRTKKLLPDGTFPEIKLSLPDGGPPIKVSCRVAHSFAPPENPNKFHIGTQFLNIEENNKARIVRFIYNLQLKRIRG